MIEASGDLGARGWQTFLKIILPQLMPRVVGGAMHAFVFLMDDLVITCLIAGTDSTVMPIFYLFDDPVGR